MRNAVKDRYNAKESRTRRNIECRRMSPILELPLDGWQHCYSSRHEILDEAAPRSRRVRNKTPQSDVSDLEHR